MNVITALTNPIWRDASVNVEVHGGNGRYEVRWPTPSGTSGAPDFTTHADAIQYAESITRAIRVNRNVAHMTALREDATRTTTIDLVLRDAEGDAWVWVGLDLYVSPASVQAGSKFVERWAESRADIEEEFGPLAVEHSIKIRGEVVA